MFLLFQIRQEPFRLWNDGSGLDLYDGNCKHLAFLRLTGCSFACVRGESGPCLKHTCPTGNSGWRGAARLSMQLPSDAGVCSRTACSLVLRSCSSAPRDGVIDRKAPYCGPRSLAHWDFFLKRNPKLPSSWHSRPLVSVQLAFLGSPILHRPDSPPPEYTITQFHLLSSLSMLNVLGFFSHFSHHLGF